VIAYVDASVVLRIVLRQPHPLDEFDEIIRGVTSDLAEVECFRTLDRLRVRGDLSDADVAEARAVVIAMLAKLERLDLTATVLRRAAEPMPTQLGTLDAIHLATALLFRESTGETPTMATHDNALALAARAHGLPVVGV
jgi:predicted nucleic acid-binding protein